MNAPSILRSVFFVGVLGLPLACTDTSARVEKHEDGKDHDRDELTRQGVEPAPARGEDRQEPAGEAPPDERTKTTTVMRGRIEALDLKLEQLRTDLKAKGQEVSASLEEERRMLGQDFEALQSATEDDWEDVRDRIDRRLESMTKALEPAGEAAKTPS